MKKLVDLLIALTMFGLLFVISPGNVDAADNKEIPKGVLLMDDKGVSLTDVNGYFFNLTDLFPGDKIIREIEIRTDRSEDIGIKIDVVPIKFTGPINLIQKVDMKWTYEGKVIFEGNLANQSKKIVDKGSAVYFGKLPAKSVRKMVVELYVSPDIPIKDLMNESSEAVVRWDVKATAEDIKEPVVKPLEKKTPTGFLPKTGEKATTLLTMLAILSVLLTLVVYQKIYLEKNTN